MAANDLDTLLAIVDSRLSSDPTNRAEPDDLIVHLRLGDLVKSLGREGGGCAFHRSAAYWGRTLPTAFRIVSLALETGSKSVTLVGGCHVDKGATASVEYVSSLWSYIQERGVSVKLKLGGDPDEAFVFMASCKRFLCSPGGFSSLVAGLVKKQGGKVWCN